MPTAKSKVSFKYGLQASYNAITSKDVNTLYFATDSQRLFAGDVEFTRPVMHGSSLPTGYLPPNSLFVKEDGTKRELYYSKDGGAWELVSVLPATIVGGVFGSNTAGQSSFGDTIKIPKVTVDNRGSVTAIEEVAVQLPQAPEATQITVIGNDGDGNVITGVTADGTTVTVTKGSMMPTAGGDFTGPVTVQAPTADMNPATKKYVDDAIGEITSFEVDANGGAGYDLVTDLPVTGTPGVFYLVKNPKTSDKNKFIEYFWTGSGYEMAGKFGDVDLSDYVTSQQLSDGLAGKVDNTITVNGQALTGNVQINDITGNAGTADKLKTPVTINGVEFDGSKNIEIATGPDSLSGLTDTTITTPADGQSLVFNGTAWVNKQIGKSDVGLGNVDNTADADKNVASAAKLTTARTISLGGDATGSASFDGSENITITASVSHSANADSATKATQDGNGDVITETYATKTELANAIVWETF